MRVGWSQRNGIARIEQFTGFCERRGSLARGENVAERDGGKGVKAKLPISIEHEVDENSIINSMKRDKKNIAEQLRLILLQKIGEPVITTSITIEAIKKALNIVWRK